MSNERLTCPEFVAFLDDYVAGRLAPQVVAAFNRHLASCPSCAAYANTYRATIRLGREAFSDSSDVPDDVPEELIAAILAARLTPSH